MENQINSALLYNLMCASSNGFIVFNSVENGSEWDLNCVFANDAAAKLTGCAHLPGSTYSAIFHIFSDNNLELLSHSARMEYKFPHSGHFCIIERSALCEGHVLCTIIEVPSKEVPDYRQKLWRDAEETMQFGGWIWDIDGVEMEWTEGMYRLMGYPNSEVGHKELSIGFLKEHIHPDDLLLFSRQMESISSYTDNYVFEFRINSADGVEKHLYLWGENVLDPNTKHLISVSTIFNISTLKLIQGELEQKVSDLNKSNSDLEQFAYIASHDLLEPLRKIVSFGERLDQKARDTLNEEQHSYLDRILNATRRMQEMINNLLEFSRVSSELKVYALSDLNEIVSSTLSDLEVAVQEKLAIVEVGNLPVIEAISAQISQLFLNLISNSLKFSKANIPPFISIESLPVSFEVIVKRKLPTHRDYVKIVVQDNGIGFESSSSDRMFKIFQRLRGRSEYEGAGIGLAVCKKVVERHGGIIDAFGVPDQGARFEIILPILQN